MIEEAGLPEGVEDLLPLSPVQSGMLYEHLRAPGIGQNIGIIAARLPADFDRQRFEAAWKTAIARHQALRSQFAWEGLSAPVQIVWEEA